MLDKVIDTPILEWICLERDKTPLRVSNLQLRVDEVDWVLSTAYDLTELCVLRDGHASPDFEIDESSVVTNLSWAVSCCNDDFERIVGGNFLELHRL